MKIKDFDTLHNNLLEGIEYAVVHLAAFVPPAATAAEDVEAQRLVCATVWLLAPGREVPPMPNKPFSKSFGSKGELEVDRIVMRADKAIQWYRSPSEKFIKPRAFQGTSKSTDSQSISVGRLSDFPRWPVLGVPIESENLTEKTELPPIPFRKQGITRYSRRISDSQAWPNFLDINGQSEECEEAFQFLEHHMHINFREYPEYIGSLILGIPDSSVHSIRQFVDPKEDGSESLYFHLTPHQGQKLDQLSLTTYEGQEGMLTSFETVDVPEDGLIEINRPSAIESAGFILNHKLRGVLLQTPMQPFLRQMNLTSEVVERRIKISAPERDGKNSPRSDYATDKKILVTARTLGEPLDNTDSFRRLFEAKRERALNQSARIHEQTWFSTDQRIEAMEHIREKIRLARNTLFIADPYFTPTQISQFLFAIERDDVTVRILTSKNATRVVNKAKEASGSKSTPKEPHEPFSELIEIFKSSHSNSIEIKIAKSQSTQFHDRFLAIDGRVWMLGSSLNSIGARPTLIMRIPHGEKILSQLSDLYDKSDILIDPSKQKNSADAQ